VGQRYIFDSDPDPNRLFDELYRDGIRDFKGLALGDVSGHARRRFTVSYGVMLLTALLEQLDRLPANAEIGARGASDQDKQVSGDEQAAHIAPCEIVVHAPGSALDGEPLYAFLVNPFNQTWVRREIFAPTDRVHRLVNVADSSCERGRGRNAGIGMVDALVELCNRTLEDARRRSKLVVGFAPPPSQYARDRFQTQLVPCYRMVASARRSMLETAMTDDERRDLARQPLVASDGRPLIARPLDTRLGSPNAEARMAARRTLREIFVIYENVDPDEAALATIAGKIDALRFNEGVRL
jgi:hypothetical protein